MTAQWLVDGVTGLAWAVVAYKLPALIRNPHDPAKRSYWLSLFAIALALTVLLPQPYALIDHTTGVPNLARLIGDGMGVFAAWAGQSLLLYANFPAAEARQRGMRLGWALILTLALMTMCFALAPSQHEDQTFTGQYAHLPAFFAYRLIFLAWLGLAMYNFTRLSWRYARISPRPSLRLGFRLVALGGVLGLGYIANDAMRTGATYANHVDPLPTTTIAQFLIAGFLATGLIGTTMPAWGPHVGIPALVGWARRYQSLRRLYPLWSAAYRANPQVALLPPASFLTDILAVRDLRFRLHRRVIEIRDGQLLLRPHRDPAVSALARTLCIKAGLADDETRAVLEAAEFAVALRRQAIGLVSSGIEALPQAFGDADLEREAAALERVAQSYRRSPVVRAVLGYMEKDMANAAMAVGK